MTPVPTLIPAAPFAADFMGRALLGGSLVAVICGVVGTWVVIRGMAFLGEAIGHGMLPGVALATLAGWPALLGAALSASAMSLTIGALQRRGRLSYDTSIGLLFVSMLSLGIIIVSHSRSFATDATAMLFGDILAIQENDVVLLGAALLATVLLAAVFHRHFVASAFDARVAATLGLRPRLAQVLLVGLVTLAVVASYQAVGTLLVVGLLLAPAVAAGQWTRRIPATMALASAFGVAAVTLGLLVSWYGGTAAGASIACAAILLAGLSAVVRRLAPRSRAVVAVSGAAVLALSGCAGPDSGPGGGASAQTPSASAEASDGAGHGAVTGAAEVGEAQSSLLTVDADGAAGLLDLITGKELEIGVISAPSALTSDGRYAFATTDRGLEIIDSGRWTWDHTDHFHYYRAEPRVIGSLPGEGAVTVSTSALSTAGSTGVFFRDSGEAVLLDNKSLSQGRIEEVFRIQMPAHAGIVAPFGSGAVVTHVANQPAGEAAADAAQGAEGAESTGDVVQFYGADAQPVPGASAACPEATGSITTRVGLVIGCADGALLVTSASGDAAPSFEHIPYPEGVSAPPAQEFAGRKGRPTVAALAGTGADQAGIWTLDTRQRSWQLHPVDAELTQVVAADDDGGHVLALGADGRVHVYAGGDGEPLAELGATEPLRSEASAPGADLVVDQQRAYANDPATGAVHEIAYAGEVRIARTLTPATPAHYFTETGR